MENYILISAYNGELGYFDSYEEACAHAKRHDIEGVIYKQVAVVETKLQLVIRET